MKGWILASVLLTLAFGGCTDAAKARRVLVGAGYTSINIGGHAWFDCGDDSVSNTFTATSPGGQRVEGAVCCGLIAKNCTIRFD